MTARRLLAELSWFVVPALAAGLWLAWSYGRTQTFIGTSDLEQTFWQGMNLLDVWQTGDACLTTSFLGIPTPYTYTCSCHYFTLPLLGLTVLARNPYFAHNALWAMILIANGSSMYAFLRLGGLSRASSSVGGGIYLLAPATIGRSLVHLYLSVSFFLPVWFYLVYRDRSRGFHPGHWVGLGALIAGMLGNHEYLGILGFGLLGISLCCNAPRLGKRRTVAAALLAGGTFTLLSLPVLWMYFDQFHYDRTHGVQFARNLNESIVMSASPRDYLLPCNYNPLFGRWLGLNPLSESFNYLGLLNLTCLVVLGWWALFRRNRLREFFHSAPLLRLLGPELAVTGLSVLLVTLGPRWKSHPGLMLPVQLLLFLHLPPFTMIRGWGRFGFVVFFVNTVLTAHLLEFWGLRKRGWLLALLLIALAGLDQIPLYWLYSFQVPVPASLAAIYREPGNFFVLNLPLHSQGGGLSNGRAQVLRLFHGKRMVTGYSSFTNPAYVRAMADSPLSCLDYMTLETAPHYSTQALGDYLVQQDIRYLIYEKNAQFFGVGYTREDDRRLRQVTLKRLQELQGKYLQVMEDSDDYRVYQVLPVTSRPSLPPS